MPVKVIPAVQTHRVSQAASVKLLRVAAYARVSTELEEQENSYQAQCEHYRKYIAEHEGWTLADVYADEGLSGVSTKCRDEFNRMIADCESGAIDLVITKSISRFSRNTLDCLQNVRKLKALGISVIFEKEGINTLGESGELFLTIMASIAQQESASISQNVRMGWQYQFQQGKPLLVHTRFLGYTKSRGDDKLTLVPEEAKIVRMIYRDFLEGFSFGRIKFRLESLGISTPTGIKEWSTNTVISILKNEKYMGDLLLQKNYVKDFLTKKEVVNDGALPQYYVENAHDPIVPKEIFSRVQGEIIRRERIYEESGTKSLPSSRRSLFGQVKCGNCSAVYRRVKTRQKNPYYAWYARHDSSCTCRRSLREADLHRYVVNAFNLIPECKTDIIRARERLLYGSLGRIQIEINDIDKRKKELDTVISDYAETGAIPNELLYKYSDGTGDAERAIERIKYESDELELIRADKLVEKGPLAVRDMQLHTLIKLSEAICRSTPHEFCKIVGEKKSDSDTFYENPDACYTVDDFYHRTDIIPQSGEITEFDDSLTARFIETIEVYSDHLLVIFKAGIAITV